MKLVKVLLSSVAAVVVAIAVTGCASVQKKAACNCTPEGAAAKASEHPAGGEHPSSTPSAATAPAPAPAPKAE